METETIYCEIDSASIPGAIMEHDPIRAVEKSSIRTYVKEHSGLLTGRVLDFGCGHQPYRSYVTGTYYPFDKSHYFDDTAYDGAVAKLQTLPFDAILCTQVLQYCEDPCKQIIDFYRLLTRGGHLVMTTGLNWDEVEMEDLSRLTRAGTERALLKCGFTILDQTRRAQVSIGRFNFPLGYGFVACK